MRILVVGAGATGGYFGARLVQAGRDVTFLVRARRAEQLRRDGLRIVSPHGDAAVQPKLVTPGDVDDPFDLVVLAVKAYGIEQALDDMAPAVGPRTAIVPFLNGMRHIDLLTTRFGEQPILGGVCVVATTLDSEGRVVQLSDMQELAYGELDGSASARLAAIDAVLAGAGFDARTSPAILQEMWEKWVMLAALGAATCLLRGTVGEIAGVPGGADIVSCIIDECAAVAGAYGHAPHGPVLERIQNMLTAQGSNLASSMYRDLRDRRPVEVEHILADLAQRARGAALNAPLLDAAVAQLRVYQAGLLV
jgi:2-dehydropantoate 2-reductase